MADTPRTFAELYALFADGQVPGSITPQHVRDFIATVERDTKSHFIVASSSTIPVSNDVDAPTRVDSYELLDAPRGFELRQADGAIRNATGRDIAGITGNIAMQIETTGGTKTLSFWSEISSDGVTWDPIANSLRVREVASSNESFLSAVSFTDTWPDGAYIRFGFVTSGDTMEFVSPSLITNGEAVSGRAIVWELTEQ